MPKERTRHKRKTSLALTPEAQRLLGKLADWWGLSQSGALEFLIRSAFETRLLAPEHREEFLRKAK